MRNVYDTADAAFPTPNKAISRRDFLGLTAALAAVVLGHRYGKPLIGLINDEGEKLTKKFESPVVDVETISWHDFDFVTHPELLISEKLKEKMSGELHGWSNVVDELWKFEQKNEKKEPIGNVDHEAWDTNVKTLIDETFVLADLVQVAEGDGLVDVLPEITRKYYEYATYLRMSLIASAYLQKLSIDEAYALTMSVLSEQNISSLKLGSDGLDLAMPEGFKRLQVEAFWNYPWHEMAEGQTSGLHKVVGQIISKNGDFVDVPRMSVAHILPVNERNVDIDPFTFGGKPKEVSIINLQPDVEIILSDKLRKVGIERGIRTLTWENISSFPQGSTSPEGNVFIGGGVEDLDLVTYKKYALVYDSLALHEGMHALEGRACMLQGSDRLKYRDNELRIFHRYDPLKSMKNIFNPEGEYPPYDVNTIDLDFYKAESEMPNYMLMTDYYVGILLGGVYGTSVHENMDELRNGIILMGGQDFYGGLWPENVSTVEEYMEDLGHKKDSMTGLSKLIAETIVTNKDDIIASKRNLFVQAPGLYYITDVVLPLTIAHLSQYEKVEMEKACIEGVEEDVARAYFHNWQMRLTDRITTTPCEEMIAEIFSTMLIDKQSNASKWSETMEDFKQMLLILKKNELAYRNTQSVV